MRRSGCRCLLFEGLGSREQGLVVLPVGPNLLGQTVRYVALLPGLQPR